ncbi:hypothetical protein OROMI_027651 [Orobanche minor]
MSYQQQVPQHKYPPPAPGYGTVYPPPAGYPSAPLQPDGYPYPPPPPSGYPYPPPPQPGGGYQAYFGQGYPPPMSPPTQVYHCDHHHHHHDDGSDCTSFLRGCVVARNTIIYKPPPVRVWLPFVAVVY